MTREVPSFGCDPSTLRWFDRSEREAKVRELAKDPGAFVAHELRLKQSIH